MELISHQGMGTIGEGTTEAAAAAAACHTQSGYL